MKKIPIRQLSSPLQELSSSERFKIRRVEDILGETDLVHDLHRHDFFFILALKKGAGNHEIDFTAYNVRDNTIFFIRPGQVHKLELKAGSTGYLVEFNTEFYHPKDKKSNQRLRKASNKNYCELEIGRFNKLQTILSSMMDEYVDKEEGYQDVIKSSLDIFFIEFVRQSQNPKSISTVANSYTQERFEEFLELLDKHIATHKQVSQYTDLMNLSPYQLNEITKSSIGKTASDMINDHIILEAKRYLLATPNQVKDIADQLGFEDPSYFIRFFKKHTRQSPEAFRQNFK
ncbi:MAG: helix-turn-helix protein [Ferruginibacter sp.]|uniref:helix-turn-helix transcriptional regulator n=1 Tax=Ferruginibacter sp. TaxID=1940288 RepID=UPI00265A1577|nr:helix-turn-helix transcriptional regulator [Ferruginibacter sp.]MDB5278574.1 helix-turn-helix protein [Ferruginibacter sp.]